MALAKALLIREEEKAHYIAALYQKQHNFFKHKEKKTKSKQKFS